MSKPREWNLLFDDVDEYVMVCVGPVEPQHEEQQVVPVIEKSAFDSLAAELESWKNMYQLSVRETEDDKAALKRFKLRLESQARVIASLKAAMEKARDELSVFGFAKDEIRVKNADKALYEALQAAQSEKLEVKIDPLLSEGEVYVKNERGEIVAKIVNIEWKSESEASE